MIKAIEHIAKVIRRVIGVPDYEAYLAHLAACHPNEPAMTRDAFHRDSLMRRQATVGSRCC